MTGFSIQLVSAPGAETDALRKALASRLELAWMPTLPEYLEEVEVLWVHAGPDEQASLGKTAAQLLRAWVLGGGRLLLTGAPAAWVGPLGFEAHPPELRSRSWEGPLRPHDRLGIAPYFDHPLFERFPGGVYLRRPAGSCRIGGAFWSRGVRPRNGRLIGVEKVFLSVQAETGLLVEYQPGMGRILALGAHLVFDDARPEDDPFAEQRLRFAADLCEFLVFGEEEAGSQWPELGRPASLAPRSLSDDEAKPLGDMRDRGFETSALAALHGETTRAFDGFVLSDRRGGILVGDRDAACECWDLPTRLFTDFRLCDDRGNVLVPHEKETRASETAVERGYAGLTELWAERDRGFAWQLEAAAHEPGALETPRVEVERVVRLCFTTDLRLAWPYPATVQQTQVASSEQGRVITMRDEAGRRGLRLTLDPAPRRVRLDEQPRGKGVACEVEFVMAPGARIRADFDLQAPRAALVAAADSQLRFAVEAPPEVATAIARAKLAVDRAFVEVAPLTPPARSEAAFSRCSTRPFRAYLAGFDRSRPGWCDGRPGPAWLFSRDAYWILRSLLPWQGPGRALATLETLAAYQDARGGIPHEVTTAGVAHYDATDATPLFVDAVVRVVEHFDDEATALRFWPHVERALAWVLESDRDGDGLLENGRGHGIVEDRDGETAIHVELGVVCAQYAGLAAGARLAARLGKDARAALWHTASKHVKDVVNDHFLDLEGGGYASYMRSDGSFVRQATALGLFPFLLGLADESDGIAGIASEHAMRLLDAFSHERFARAEGLRFLPTDDASYRPDGYQHGACWPMLGALLALVEAQTGREDRARERIGALARFMASDGSLPEIVGGDDALPIGVCRHHTTASAVWLGAVAELYFARDAALPPSAASAVRDPST